MLGKLRERRQRRREDIERRLAIVDAVYGRLDGEDTAEVEENMLDDLRAGAEADLPDLIDNNALIEMLEAQLAEAMAVVRHQGLIVSASRAFAETISAINTKTGEAVFKTTHDDDLAVALLNHRYSDLASLLNGNGPKVPGKLPQGTIH